jgi:ATP-dependent exoDNAse (exonuclease V) beta subunit
LLSLFSFESGLSPALSVIDDDEKEVLFQESLSKSIDVRTWNEIDELGQRFSIERNDTRYVIKSISDNARNNALDVKQLELSRDDSVKSLKSLLPKPTEDQEKIQKEIKKMIPAVLKKAKEIGDSTQDTTKSVEALADFYHKQQLGFKIPWADWATSAEPKVGATAKRASLFDSVAELMQAHIRFPEFQNDLFNYIKLCFDVAIRSMEAYTLLKKERGLVDFIDQESLLLDALDHTGIQQRFREQFKVLFVDEFQDTSPLQLSLFIKISSLVEKVIWVGDSKQAIYGFRNSDSQLINCVTKALGKPDARDILKTSYRSRPELVSIVNGLFLQAFKDNEKALTDEQIILIPDRKNNKQLQTAFQLWGFQWKASRGQWDTTDKYQSQIASKVAAFLRENNLVEDPHSKTTRAVKAGDISILCRTNKNCIGIANALRNQGLQAAVSDAGLNLTAEWRLLKACLHLLVDENDSLSKSEIKFLTSIDHNIPAMLEDRLLFLQQAGDDYESKSKWLIDDPIIQWINEHRSSLLSQSISGIIQLIYAGLHFHNTVMKWGNGAQRHANLQQVLNYSLEFEEYCSKVALLPNVHGFISWFDGLTENQQDKRGLVTNEFSVNVLTYHAAKGLEWPVVILCDLDDQREPDVFSVRVNPKDKIDFKDPLRDRGLRFWPWPYRTTIYRQRMGLKEFKDRCNNSEDYTTLEVREQSESLRLLYVGFTRARDYLIVPFKSKSQDCYLKAILENGISSFADLDNFSADKIIPKSKLFNQPIRLWVTDYNDYADEVKNADSVTEVYQGNKRKEYAPYYRTPSGSLPVEDVSFKEGISIHNSFSDNKPDGERSDFGTFIHRVFCAYKPTMNEDQIKDLINRLGVCYGFDKPVMQKELLYVVHEFYNWLAKEFTPGKIYNELPLMMERDGQLVDGIADLVIETDHEIILIDYKTFIGDLAQMQWKAKTFSGQLKLYMDILRQGFPGKNVRGGIYFVMKGFVVWMGGEQVEMVEVNTKLQS